MGWRGLLACAAAAVACGGGRDGSPAREGQVCVPGTCAAAGGSCGAVADGCGRVLECGPCDPTAAARILSRAGAQLARTAARLSPGAYPKSTRADGTWRTVAAGDVIGWTQGFFPGSLWAMYEATGDDAWRERADAWTRPLEVQKTNATTHDTGFKIARSFGAAYRATGDAHDRDVLLAAAASLASRFDPGLDAIVCCEWNPDWARPVVIDTLPELELLLLAADAGGDPRWRDLALRHALVTLRDLVRPDGSTWHVADYDPATGALRWRGTYQGASDRSTWSRGQAWAILGFAMAHRYLGDPRLLEAARRTADLYLARVPDGAVPSWDLDAAERRDDSSAAAIVASGLLDLAEQLLATDAEAARRYRAAALLGLEVLASPAYLSEGDGTEGVLRHGVGNLPAGEDVDVSLVYGDHFAIEAALRARRLER